MGIVRPRGLVGMAVCIAGFAAILWLSSPGPLTGPAAHPWASFPAGTWAEFRWSVGGRAFVERWEIVEVRPDAVRLRVVEEGRAPEEQVLATVEEPLKEAGTETLKLAGRSFECRRLERGTYRRWVAAELPAWPVREESAEGVTTLAAIGEEAGGRRCMVFETVPPEGGRIRRWKSLEVPGHVVREVRATEIGEAVVELRAFGR